jgi:hypothetical protein
MKKSLYVAASALLALAACSKENVAPETSGDVFNVALDVTVPQTKASYDGKDAIAFANGDYLTVAVAKESAPDTLIKVATRSGGLASTYQSKFRIVDPAAATPVFSGSLYSIVEADYADHYKTYFAFPSDAFTCASTASEWKVNVKDSQSGYSNTWDGAADALLGVPADIYTATASYDSRWKEYSLTSGVSTNLAHLFGFCKLTYSGISSKYLTNNLVNSVVIEAVGTNKDIAGRFSVDISKTIGDVTLTPSSTSSKITVTPAESTDLGDLTTWFVAAPGTYDVKITVNTNRAVFVFERTGLVIERGKIAAPTVHLKETDELTDQEVTLASHQNWEYKFASYSGCFSSTRKVMSLGPDGYKMNFTLSYPGALGSNYGSAQSGDDGYVQRLNYNYLTGAKKINLSSLASFKNVESVKVSLGNFTENTTYDFSLALVNNGDTTVVKTVSVPAPEKKLSMAVKNYYLENNTEVKDGDLVLIVDNVSDGSAYPLLGSLVINFAPEVAPEVSELNIGIEAASGTIACPVYASSNTPTVASSADWLTVSYADGVISYSATENTDVKRTATITVTLVDGEVTSTKTVNVIQKSAVAREYKLTITPAQVKALADAYLAENPDASTAVISTDLTAYGTDHPELSTTVPVKFNKLKLAECCDDYFTFYYYLDSTAEVGHVQKVVVKSSRSLTSSSWAYTVRLSNTGSTWSYYGSDSSFTNEEADGIYTGTYVPEDQTYTYFRILSSMSTYKTYQIDVYFVVGD